MLTTKIHILAVSCIFFSSQRHTMMATIIRIKRRHDEEPTENIIVKAKRSRVEEEDGAAALCESSPESSHTIMTRVGTVNSKVYMLYCLLHIPKNGKNITKDVLFSTTA